MTLPAIVTVKATIGDASGPQAGRIVWHRTLPLSPAAAGDLNYLIPEEVESIVGPDGVLAQPLYASNDPAVSPTGWTWTATTFFPNWKTTFSVVVPYDAAGGEVRLNDLVPVPPDQDAQLYALANHTHLAAQVTDLSAAVRTLFRVVDAGEYVIPRGEATTEAPLTTGNLYVTHFTAAKSETIQTIRTGVGANEATGAQHAWVGVMSWDGTQYTPVVASVDDPTRWATEFASYDTQIYAWNHAGEVPYQGWNKVAGTDYALWALWIGAGNPPSLFSGGGNYQDCLEAPRTNAYIGSQTQPPAAPISGAFFGPDSRRFQALLKR